MEVALIALAVLLAWREYANAKERQTLLDRIQAPEHVIYRTHENGPPEDVPEPTYLPWGGEVE